jgi:hypothetical protein
MHIKTHVASLTAIAAAIVVFPTTFAHQHNQAVFTASDIIDQARER